MVHLLVSISRFTLIIMFAIYTYDCFAVLKRNISEKKQKRIYHRQNRILYLFLLNANAVLFATTMDFKVLALFGAESIFFAVTLFIYKKFYQNASRSLVNNMCMLLAVGFVILTRLNFSQALRQFFIATAAMALTCFIPIVVAKLKVFNRLAWLYALVGIAGLLVVAVAATTEYGAKLSLKLGPVTIQPSEFIKIIFVFFCSAMLVKSVEFVHVVKTTMIAALHVLILVASKDLGGAFIFLITYLAMLYVASRQPVYLLLGTAASIVAAVAAFFLFSHVRNRVIAWKDPLSVIEGAGYQVSQSLFAIGTGGWFGLGLNQGMPTKIPVVTKDFVFAAISEEMGGVFALCLIFVCISCFLMFFNIAMQMRDLFYKLVALGLATVYGTQVFLTLGGVIKFIPSTGVTLPLVSYGGSSLLATMILFATIQGLYVLHVNEGVEHETNKKKPKRAR